MSSLPTIGEWPATIGEWPMPFALLVVAAILFGFGTAVMLKIFGLRNHQQRAGHSFESMEPPRSLRLAGLDRRLTHAGVPLPAPLFLILLVLVALSMALTVGLLVPDVLLWSAFLVFFLVPVSAFAGLAELEKRRTSRFETRLVDSVDLMVASLEAGENTVAALGRAAENSLSPLRSELRRVVELLQAGADFEPTLNSWAERWNSEGLRFLTRILIAKWQLGGPLAEDLKAINRTLRSRRRLHRELESHLAGAQATALVIAALPYLLVPFLLWLRPESLHRLTGQAWGLHLIALAVALQVIGFLTIRRLLRTEL